MDPSFLASGALCLSLWSSAAFETGGRDIDPQDELKEADRAFCKETRERGVDGWLSWFAPEAIVFPPVGPIARGAAERELFFRGRPFPPPGFAWEPDDAWCATSHDLGFTRGTWSADAARSGETRPSGRYLSVWKRIEGRWLVLTDLSDDPRFLKATPSDRPLGSHAHEVQHSYRSADGALLVEAGVVHCASWARHLTVSEPRADARTAKFLRLWRKGDSGELELAHETGAFDLEAPRLEPWPEADALFRRDPRWRGGDGASSIALGGERILWLFADSFVAAPEGKRAGSRMVRNSIAIQRGVEPLTAALEFHWNERDGEPRSFFALPEADERERWLWPASGVRVGERVLLCFFVVRPSTGGLGFALERSRAAFVDEPDLPPHQWRLRWIETPHLPEDLSLGGGGCFVEADHVVAISPQGANHAVKLVRWPLARVEAGELGEASAWCGMRSWRALDTSFAREGASLAPLFAPAQAELTLHRVADGTWLALHGFGFGPAPLGMRTASALEGPWSSLRLLHRPEEAERAQVLIYAAKTHPELRAPGFLAATYVVNTLDFGALVSDESLYFPRFLKLRLP